MNDLLIVVCGTSLVLSLLAFCFSLRRIRQATAEPLQLGAAGCGRTRWFLVLLTLGTAGAIAAVWLLMPPLYRATALVRITPVIERVVYNTERNGAIPYYDAYLNTEVAVLGSSSLLRLVLDRPEIASMNWYKKCMEQRPVREDAKRTTEPDSASEATGDRCSVSLEPDPRAEDGLRRCLEVKRQPGTELIEVSIRLPDAEDARTLANIVIAEYKMLNAQLQKASDVQLFDTLTTGLEGLQFEIDGLIKTKSNIASRIGTTSLEEVCQQRSRRLDSMQVELCDLRRDQDIAKWELDSLAKGERSPERTSPASPATRPGAADESSLKYLVQKQQRQIELLQRDIAQQQDQIKEGRDIALQMTRYDEFIRQKRELYEAMRARREVLQVEAKAPGRVRIASYANLPTRPTADRQALLTIGVLAAAAILFAASVSLGRRNRARVAKEGDCG